ncbi:probable F-box protein At2g36090 [Euphorbia lathyris]|uniref:probable F-box protein At2g36090 n=1 Tax=Euphorbia lathyris TaxID=212925 RepID=UPI003313EACC
MSPPSSSTAAATSTTGDQASISSLPPDILQTHILTHLDGPALASAACASKQLSSLAFQQHLWADICHSTFPSTDISRLRNLISAFPDGPRSFFSAAFPLLSVVDEAINSGNNRAVNFDLPLELISAVDIYYRNQLIFSRVVETETESGWFRCSPFRIDMLDPKDTCPTPIPHPNTDDERKSISDELTLSWILIDPSGRRAMNLSSHKPVSVQRHWLSGEVHARFASVLRGEKGFVQCGILVTCGGGIEGGGMQVREVSLQVEDMDGVFLNGKGSLGILHKAFEGKKGIKGRNEGEGKRKYEGFLEMKRERKERKVRTEGTLDILCVAFGVLASVFFALFVFFT